MDWSKYSSLKSGSKVSWSDEGEGGKERVVLSQKRFSSESGEAQDDSKREYLLSELESEKKRYDDDHARAKAQSDGLAAAIADFKKL